MVKRIALVLLAALAIGAGVYAYVARPLGSSPPPQAAAPAPPPEVGVVVVQPADTPLPVEFAGRVAAFRDVEIRPLVGGRLLKREYEEGAKVDQGQVLFRIDPALFQVAQTRAEAQLTDAQAKLRDAEDNFTRIEQLARRGVSTDVQLDQARAARDQARAGVQLAEAEVAGAKLNLGYTVVNAPIAGVTALQSPPVGTLVQAQQTLLTTITQLDPAYVNFSFTDEEGQAFRLLNERREKPIAPQDLTVDLQFGTSLVYPQPGKIDTAAQRVDPQTGTIQARAIFPNREGILLPGQFVRVRIRGISLPDAIVVPKAAVSQGPQGPTVYVLGENDVAQARPVRLGEELPTGQVVRDGLRGGDRVVADGVMRVRPGAPVKPVLMKPESVTTQATGSSAPDARP
jgi:membrane fusion protein (multidrug efflux system)